jgi:uncharacterized heparinase superfamily protein
VPDRLSWYAARLRSMPPREFLHRVTESTRKASGRRWRPPPTPALSAGAPRLAELVLGFPEPATRVHWKDCAAAFTDGRIALLGVEWQVAGPGPDWALDPATGRRWPSGYCFDVDYRHGCRDLADVKYVWELNRLQFLIPVAAHAAVEGDRRLAAEVAGQVEDWVAKNPACQGVVWSSGIELAIRALSMLTVLELVEHLGPAPQLRATVVESVHQQLSWLRRFPSLFSSANNHRVAELAAVAIAGSALPGLVSADQLAAAWDELGERALQLFCPDGVAAEQAPGYGLLSLEWLTICLAIDGRLRFAPSVIERIRDAAEAIDAIRDCAGNVVAFGDDDGSRLLTSALPAAVAIDVVLDLAGGVPSRRSPAVRTFPVGGYTVGRALDHGAETLWLFDHGPLGYGHLAAHGHADNLAVWAHRAGRPLFVEAGTYLYHRAGPWRDYLRGTGCHNTLRVAGVDSSLSSGPFNWLPGRRARGVLRSAGQHGHTWWAEADHDGYQSGLGIRHRRRIERVDDAWYRLTDWLDGGEAAVRWSLLLAPDLELVEQESGWVVRRGGAPVCTLEAVEAPDGWRWETARGRGAPDLAGWCSPRFGELEPAWQLFVHARLSGGSPLVVDVRFPDAEQEAA